MIQIKRVSCLLFAVCLLAGVLSAQEKKAVTHEAIWLMKRVGAPVPSPDGKWVAFSVTEPSYADAEQVSDLWLVAADGGGKPRRLTNTKGGESGAVWSPDGARVAFAAKREGDDAAQIYVLDIINGGEAQRVTNLSTGAHSPQWRPDGGALLFQSVVYPGALDDDANKKIAAERKAQKYKARVYEGFPVRQWDKWLDDTQTHVFVQEFGKPAKDLLAGTALVKKKGFGGAFSNSSENLQAVWSPDGASIVFAADTERDTAAYSEFGEHLFQVAATGGEPRQLTDNKYSFGAPQFSPDGKTLACSVTENGKKVYYLTRLAVFSWPNPGAPNIITANSERSVGGFRFAPDSRMIYFTAEDAGLEKLYSVPTAGGEVKLAFGPPTGVLTNLAIPAKANVILANWDSATNPPEIVRLDLASNTAKPLTAFNQERAAGLDLPSVRHFWFASKGGKKIHNLAALPPNFDPNKKYPLFVVIHGGPAGMWRDSFGLRWNYHLLAAPGYVVLLTNYTGSTGFGEKFGQAIEGDPFKTPGEEINQAADEAIKQFSFIDATRQAAGGASYGGHLANWLNATTTRYKCLVSHAGLVNAVTQWGASDTIYFREITNGGPHWENGPLWREQNPITYAAKFKTPILVTVGENDFRVPINNSLENWAVLQRQKVPSRLIVFPEENHWILRGENSRFFYQEVHAWLKKWL